MKKIERISVGQVFDERFFIMGIGMLWMMVFHADVWLYSSVLRFVKEIGYGGVDMFLMCSGFGCFCSLEKNADVVSFLDRRVRRIMPVWLTFMLFWIPVTMSLRGLPVTAMIGNILCVQSFTGLGNDMNWYVSALWLYYILSPYLHGICKRCSLKRNLLVVCLLFAFSVPFWGAYSFTIIVSRLPVYYLGMLLAKHRADTLDAKKTIAVLCAGAAGTVWIYWCMENQAELLVSHALYWYPFILITFAVCIVCLWLAKGLLRLKFTWLYRGICATGRNSFEMFLVHALVYSILREYVSRGKLSGTRWQWLLALVISFPLAWCFGRLVSCLTGMVTGKFRRTGQAARQ